MGSRLWGLFSFLEYLVSLHSPIPDPRAHVNRRGLPMSFGAFQSFYVTQYLPNHSSSSISWIGTLQAALLIMLGLVSGPLYDLGYYRMLLCAGAFITVLGMMLLSISTQYYQVFLSQGLCVGVGCGLLYVPTMSLVGGLFSQRRAIAMSLMTSGIALGQYSLNLKVLILT